MTGTGGRTRQSLDESSSASQSLETRIQFLAKSAIVCTSWAILDDAEIIILSDFEKLIIVNFENDENSIKPIGFAKGEEISASVSFVTQKLARELL
ncbi:MAG: hypothetical protein ACI9UA_001694 [Pseudoalteromonas tetraodonis]